MKYHISAAILHWLIAILVIGLLFVGFYFENLGKDQLELKITLINFHKSTGILVLFLSILRLFLRFFVVKPPELNLSKGKMIFAKSLHHLFYFLIIFMPLSGWIMSSLHSLTSNSKITFYGLFDNFILPLSFIGEKEMVKEIFSEIHEYTAFVIIGLLILHVLAAFYHSLILKDKPFSRMYIGK